MLLLHHNPGRQGLHENWRSHVDSHHEPSPSQRDMQISYTLRAGLVFLAGLAPAKHLDESQIARRLGAQERNGRWSRYRADTFCASDRRADCLHHPALKLVLSRGNAPRSLAYQASALLLSYERSYGRSLLRTVITGARPSSDRAPSVVETSPESRLGLAKTSSRRREEALANPCCRLRTCSPGTRARETKRDRSRVGSDTN